MPTRNRRLRNAAKADALALLSHQGFVLTPAETRSLEVTVEYGSVTINWKPVGASPAAATATLVKGLLQDVELRLQSGGSKDALAKHARRVPRNYRDELYRKLGESTPITEVLGPYPGAFVSLRERLRDILLVTRGADMNFMKTPEGITCVVARLGIDGTSRWDQPLEVWTFV